MRKFGKNAILEGKNIEKEADEEDQIELKKYGGREIPERSRE